MDGLSGAASVIAIIQITAFIGSALMDYYATVRGAKEEIQKLYHAIKSLESILSTFRDILNRPNKHHHVLSTALFDDSSGPLRQLELELHKLSLQLQVPDRGKHELRSAMRSLTWPFEKDVEKAVATINGHKAGLTLEIGVENL